MNLDNKLIEDVLHLISEASNTYQTVSASLTQLDTHELGFDITIDSHPVVFNYYYGFNLSTMKDYDTELWDFSKELKTFKGLI